MSIACVYFDGFTSLGLDKEGNAFLKWRDDIFRAKAYFNWVDAQRPLGKALDYWLSAEADCRLIINEKANESDSLITRWHRLQRHFVWLLDSGADVHILAYSLGCHLAVKFASELQKQKRNTIKSFKLIGPDPKFRPNDLDAIEPSAQEQVRELWSPSSPADSFCAKLRGISEATKGQVRIIYSEDDNVALWEGNTEILKRRCPDGKNFEWKPSNEQPGKACSEFWIHYQLFTEPGGTLN